MLVGAQRADSAGTSAGLGVLAALGKVEALNRRAFFVVVPGLDHQKRKWMAASKYRV